MNLKDSIKALFKTEGVKLEVSETKLAEAVLEDGTKIYSKAEEWIAEVDVFLLNEENEEIPLPIGEYTLEDGTVLIVEEVGIVASVGGASEEVEEEMSEELTKDDVLNALEVGIGMLRNEFNAQFKELKEDNVKLSKEIEGKEKEIETIKAEFEHEGLPKGEPKKEKSAPIDLSKLTSTKERFAAIQENLNK